MARSAHRTGSWRSAEPGSEHRRLVLILLGALGVAALSLAVLRWGGGVLLANGCAMSAPFGWTIPIMTAFVVIGVGWLLMSQARGHESDDSFDTSTVACPGCGKAVLRDWRLCPYCTAVLDEETAREEHDALDEETAREEHDALDEEPAREEPAGAE